MLAEICLRFNGFAPTTISRVTIFSSLLKSSQLYKTILKIYKKFGKLNSELCLHQPENENNSYFAHANDSLPIDFQCINHRPCVIALVEDGGLHVRNTRQAPMQMRFVFDVTEQRKSALRSRFQVQNTQNIPKYNSST